MAAIKLHTFSVLSFASLLTACSNEQQAPKEEPVVEAPAPTTVRTVQYYLDQPAERERIVTDCDNNPGELAETPNCVNAYEADRKALSQGIREALGKEAK